MDNKITTYIINLEKSKERREYMTKLLSQYDFLDIRFQKAIDGRLKTQKQLESEFDYKKCESHIGRALNAGEVGCVLSHRKCYASLLESDLDYVLIFEDDISIMRPLTKLLDYDIERILNSEEPRVLLISGDFWYLKRDDIVKAYDAVGAYGYFINRAAAKLILTEIQKPYSVADDWSLYKRLGLGLYAIRPYMVDANLNMDTLKSDVNQDTWSCNRKKMSLKEVISSYQRALVKRFLKQIFFFESKIKVREGKIVNIR